MKMKVKIGLQSLYDPKGYFTMFVGKPLGMEEISAGRVCNGDGYREFEFEADEHMTIQASGFNIDIELVKPKPEPEPPFTTAPYSEYTVFESFGMYP